MRFGRRKQGAAVLAAVVVLLTGCEVLPVTNPVTVAAPDGWVFLAGGTGDVNQMVNGSATGAYAGPSSSTPYGDIQSRVGFGSLQLVDSTASGPVPEAVDTRAGGMPLAGLTSVSGGVRSTVPSSELTVAIDVDLGGGATDQLRTSFSGLGTLWNGFTGDASTTWLDSDDDPFTFSAFLSAHPGATIADGASTGVRLLPSADGEVIVDNVDIVTTFDAFTSNFEPAHTTQAVATFPSSAVSASGATLSAAAGSNGVVTVAGDTPSLSLPGFDGESASVLSLLRFRAYGDSTFATCDLPLVEVTFADWTSTFNPCVDTLDDLEGVGWHEIDATAGEWTPMTAGPPIGWMGLSSETFATGGSTPAITFVPQDGQTSFVLDSVSIGMADTRTTVKDIDFLPQQVFVAPPATTPAPASAPVVAGPGGGGQVTLQTPTGAVTINLQGGNQSGSAKVESIADPSKIDTGSLEGLVAWEVTVTGGTFQQAEICFDYPSSTLSGMGDDRPFRLLHRKADGTVEDVTTTTSGNRICGAVTSFSPFVLAELPVDRQAGADVVATAAASSAATFAPGVPVAYLASAGGYADALGAGAAGKGAGPVLLVGPGGLDDATRSELRRLAPKRVVILGGPQAVPAIEAEVGPLVPGPVTRIAGADRYATSAALSAATFAPGVPVAYVATGAGFADALGAGAAAVRDGGPVLLTRPGALPAAVAAELARLHPGRIVIVGGTQAVDGSVAIALASLTTGTVTRVAGADRYETAAALAATFPTGVGVVIATGSKAGDALVGAPVAAGMKGPILLVAPDAVPMATASQLARLAPKRIVVLGGTAAVPDGLVRSVVTATIG